MKSVKIFITILAVVVCNTACQEDFIDKTPKDQVLSSNFYKTEEDAYTALVAVYDALGIQNTSASWAPFVTVSDILSDDANAGGADANDGRNQQQLNDFDIETTNVIVLALYQKNYIGIFRANLLLEQIVNIEASEAFKARVIAECKFLRAYFYFELARFFENIPLLSTTVSGPSEFTYGQAPVEDTYALIAQDLLDASEDLPASIAPEEYGRVSQWAAKALLARVFLFYNGVYGLDIQASEVVDRSLALAHLEDLIQNSGHELLPNYEDLFRLASEHSIESVFEITHGDSPATGWEFIRGGEGNLAAQMQGPRVESGSTNWNRGWSYAPATQSLVDAFDPSDPRLDATVLFESELDGDLTRGYQHSGYFSQKYSSDAEHWGSDGSLELNRTCNFRVIRYADVLLMAAELGSPNAQNYLDQVRARAGMPSIPATDENIFNERRLELALEGIRYFDVIRRGLDYADSQLTSTGVRGPNYVGDQVIFDTTFDRATRGFLPIPDREIGLTNGDIVQNEGY